MFRTALSLLLILGPVPVSWAASLPPACPGPTPVALPADPPGPPAESGVRTLLETARTVRDVPSGRKIGEAALSRAKAELSALLSARPKEATLHALAGERDLLLVQYRGFPAGMSYGKKAKAQNDRALALDPDNAEAHLSKGIELFYKPWFVGGSVPKALSEFERANRLRPDDPRILSWIGVALHRLGRPGAHHAMTRVLALCPASPLYEARAKTFDPRAAHR